MNKKSAKVRRSVYHVVPKDDGWLVKLEVAEEGVFYDTKSEALAVARRLAKGATLGQVIEHNEDGTICDERTYPRSSDPERHPG